MDIFKYLNDIKQRPGMYVNDSDHSTVLREIQLLVYGYEAAISAHNIDEVGSNFTKRFGEFLNKKYGYSIALGPIKAIEHGADSPEQALHNFWQVIDDFKDAHRA